MPTVDRQQRRREMIAALQKIAADEGPDVSVAKFCRRCGFSNTHIYYYFENWADLRLQAGLPPRVNRSRIHARHTRQSLLEALHRLAETLGPTLAMRDFCHHTGISTRPIERVFGSWRDFKAAAGLTQQRKPGLPPQHTAESLRELVRKMLTEHGWRLTLNEFCEQTGVSREIVYRNGGWCHLRRELGYRPRGKRCQLLPDDPLFDVVNDLFDPSELLGKEYPPLFKL